jgi:hypothetical protein
MVLEVRKIIQQKIDRETRMDREISKLRFYYYIIQGVVCVRHYLIFTLVLKQKCKSIIFTTHKE